MTVRWKTGKEPTRAEVRAVITNALPVFMPDDHVRRIVDAVFEFYKARLEGRK